MSTINPLSFRIALEIFKSAARSANCAKGVLTIEPRRFMVMKPVTKAEQNAVISEPASDVNPIIAASNIPQVEPIRLLSHMKSSRMAYVPQMV